MLFIPQDWNCKATSVFWVDAEVELAQVGAAIGVWDGCFLCGLGI